MKLHELRPAEGATKRRKRVGRGRGSGHGKTSGRGHKGQGARAGGGKGPYFEGGQLPLVRRLPFKRGFTNIFRIEYQILNLKSLQKFPPNAEVNPQVLKEEGLIKGKKPVKILGEGEITNPLTVLAHSFSRSAREKIEAKGGKVQTIKNAQESASLADPA